MEGRKWEDLNIDCLVNVFGRVEMESLLLDVPFVCKSWYSATLSPLCWRRIDFNQTYPWWLFNKHRVKDSFSINELIKFLVKRSDKSATYLSLLKCRYTEETLLYVAEGCPNLRTLMLPNRHILKIPNLMSKWKNLEFLTLGSTFYLQEVIAQISIYCKNFVGLTFTSSNLEDRHASAIATFLPNIKYLDMKKSTISQEKLAMILKGCKELEYVDVSNCIGFEEDDEEILKLASHISTFKSKGSKLFDDDDDYNWCYEDIWIECLPKRDEQAPESSNMFSVLDFLNQREVNKKKLRGKINSLKMARSKTLFLA